MFKWKKLGKIFDPANVEGREWMKEFAQAPSALIFEDFVRVYFACRPNRDENGQYVSYTGFADLDRKDITRTIKISEKPVLELGEFGTFDEFGTYPLSALRQSGEIHAYYGGWTRCESVPFNVAIGRAISHDNGVTFKKTGPGPVLSYSTDEPFVLSGPKIRIFGGKWYLFYISGKRWIMNEDKRATGYKAEPVYKIRLAISDDGINFKKTGKDLIGDKLGPDEAQASPDVFYYKNKYHMFFCYRYGTNYRMNDRGYRIGYAYSYDLVNWTRDDSLCGISISESGWDSESISYPHVFELDGVTYMFYLGDQVGRFGFGAARLISFEDIIGKNGVD